MATKRTDVWASGDAYEPYVGRWSRLVARQFVTWLGVPENKEWLIALDDAKLNDWNGGRGELKRSMASLIAVLRPWSSACGRCAILAPTDALEDHHTRSTNIGRFFGHPLGLQTCGDLRRS